MDSEVRKRRPQQITANNGKEDSSRNGSSEDALPSRNSGARIDRSFTSLLAVAGLVIAATYLLLTLWPDSPFSLSIMKIFDSLLIKLGLCSQVFVVVLDAGSTGSRVLAFTFLENPVTGRLLLLEELWQEVKPGLSAFADDPAAGAATIQTLIDEAKAIVPPHLRARTPVSLKATAGLRLLPAHQSEALIEAVSGVLVASGFDNRGVEIMSELHEGLFGWVTINYLLEQMHNPRKSYVALDLGGGSTQITFVPKYDRTLQETPSDFLHPVSVIRDKMTIYSHSYLGLGLMAAREAIFSRGGSGSPNAVEQQELSSPCMPATATWTHNSRQLTIHPNQPSYQTCMIQVMEVIDSLQVHQSEEVPTRKIAAFSYFYDRAVDAGMLQQGESAVVQVQDFLDAAESACHRPRDDHPFLCVDLTFIAGMLHHGYRLAADAKLGLYKKINGYQASWALGAAFDLLEK